MGLLLQRRGPRANDIRVVLLAALLTVGLGVFGIDRADAAGGGKDCWWSKADVSRLG